MKEEHFFKQKKMSGGCEVGKLQGNVGVGDWIVFCISFFPSVGHQEMLGPANWAQFVIPAAQTQKSK